MKATLSTTGHVEIKDPDLTDVFKRIARRHKDSLLEVVKELVEEKLGLTTSRIQYDTNLDKIVAIINDKKDEGSTLLGAVKTPRQSPANNAGFKRPWKGFYNAGKDIFDELRAKKKKSIRFDEFYNLLLDYDDVRSGGKLFVKKDMDKSSPNYGQMIQIPKSRVRQYLTKSQLARTPLMKGIKVDEKTGEFKFI